MSFLQPRGLVMPTRRTKLKLTSGAQYPKCLSQHYFLGNGIHVLNDLTAIYCAKCIIFKWKCFTQISLLDIESFSFTKSNAIRIELQPIAFNRHTRRQLQ